MTDDESFLPCQPLPVSGAKGELCLRPEVAFTPTSSQTSETSEINCPICFDIDLARDLVVAEPLGHEPQIGQPRPTNGILVAMMVMN